MMDAPTLRQVLIDLIADKYPGWCPREDLDAALRNRADTAEILPAVNYIHDRKLVTWNEDGKGLFSYRLTPDGLKDHLERREVFHSFSALCGQIVHLVKAGEGHYVHAGALRNALQIIQRLPGGNTFTQATAFLCDLGYLRAQFEEIPKAGTIKKFKLTANGQDLVAGEIEDERVFL